MTFQQLLQGAEVLSQSGNPGVAGVEYDSRRVRPGTVFVAIKGETSDGNRFIDQAIAAGAVAIVTDSAAETPRPGVAWAQVLQGRRALARVSANFYMRPAERIAIVGITGTNGKSTTAFLIESILRAAGRKSALVGTIEYHVAGKILPAPHTTPEALELNRLLAEGLSVGVTDAVMEVSSHALEQQRVFGIPFDVAVFTNLTRDHLDYHGTIENYFRAKQILFEGCGTEPPRAAVLNIDDEYGRQLWKICKKKSAEVLSYGLAAGDFHAEAVEITPRGTRFQIVTPSGTIAIWSPLIGRVNVYNVLAAAAAGYARNCSAEAIAKGIFDLASVPGRFERVDCGQAFTVVVDYAHTDDALRNLTGLAREFVDGAGLKGKVITLFGCGGDRDRAKRPLMGEAAGVGSDFVVLTSDNPRSEDPIAIMNDALVGLQKSGARYSLEPDRGKAIAFALGQAAPGDIVLLAGKGHEKVQVTRQGSIPFDDVEVARGNLKSMGFDCKSVAKAGIAGKNA
ncbi:MAG TPA: UDP-N-acetylmuramoyl-L-alanyl-D-glutamate--2,6-diaminopimelate ligase [Terriglobales bacterium]|jgi:UDP-N-acetylmuramoyl-L-alanyl-D-glutamate--2,6-diaminopimelate ligase|nr:UDP-N-acetylmuramoyl-L-alanyl-D-glutamate--2,6-diaminopimelate ligase [Terriglobales bacterium]